MSGELARGGRSDSEDGMILGDYGFGRDRARSFYGRVVAANGDVDGEGPEEIGPVSKATLRRVLDEDYEVYKAGVSAKQNESAEEKADASLVKGVDERGGDDDRERNGAVVKEVRGLEGTAVARKARSFQVFGTEVSVSVDSGSRSGSDLGVSGLEMDRLLAGVEMPRLSGVTVPLFVEEVGGVPRAAIVKGKVKRVKVCEEAEEVDAKDMGGLCGLGWLCLDGERKKWKRRRKRKGNVDGQEAYGRSAAERLGLVNKGEDSGV